MLSTTNAVWRHLLVASRAGRRRWSSIGELAAEVEAPISTVHDALAHPVEIGAVEVTRRAGVRLLDPARVLILLAAERRLQRDIVERWHVAAPAREVERGATGTHAILGGFGAIVAARDGVNAISDYSTLLFYGHPRLKLDRVDPGSVAWPTEILVAEPDPRLARYGRVTPACQAYADLFALPSWQAARFIEQLDPREVAEHDGPVLLV